jgi:hypothetical protein
MTSYNPPLYLDCTSTGVNRPLPTYTLAQIGQGQRAKSNVQVGAPGCAFPKIQQNVLVLSVQ